jgi:hypothetical protein
MPILGVIASQISGHLTPPDTGAMFPLGMVSVGSGGSSTITFSSIPATYTHLQIRAIARSTRASVNNVYVNMQINSDTGSNYSYHDLYGDGSTPTAGAITSANQNYIQRITASTATASVFGTFVIDILDYANTNKYKTLRSLGGFDLNGSGQIYLVSGLWRNTNAITTLQFTSQATGDFAQYSQFALYGIKGA